LGWLIFGRRKPEATANRIAIARPQPIHCKDSLRLTAPDPPGYR